MELVAPMIPGAVVTASGTGAEMNAGAVIIHEEKERKGPILKTAAFFAVLGSDYTMSVPRVQVLSGVFDTLSHAMETYLGNSDQDNVSDDVALAVIHPAYYCHILKDAPEKFTRLARVVFGVDTAEAGIEILENLIRECGLSAKMCQLKSMVEITETRFMRF